MPRGGDNVYHLPSTDVVTNTTIESTVENAFRHDVENDLNLPRPISAGGTGGTSPSTARDNIDAEVANQTVTNYDSHTFESGSFVSTASALGTLPVAGQSFSGTAYLLGGGDILLEAYSRETGLRYIRRKTGGSWGAWKLDDIDTANGLTLLSAQNAAGASSVVFNNLLTNAYEHYVVEAIDLVPATDNVAVTIEFSS